MVFPVLNEEISNLFQLETSTEFVKLISKLIVRYYEEASLDISHFLKKAFDSVKEQDNGFLTFFKVLGCRLMKDPFSNQIENDLAFFSKTIAFYFPEFERLKKLFFVAYEKKNVSVLCGFLKDLKFAERLVELLLKEFDVVLLGGVIKDLDHSFYPLFVKPLLGEMSSSSGEASKIFSFIVPRLAFTTRGDLSKDWLVRITTAKESLEALLDFNKIPEYKSKCPTSIKLRGYQREGVKWINFLFSFNLNGILADDMGLGKTIQVLYFVCSEIYKTKKKVLVLCPSSLTGHWESEITKYFPFIVPSIHKRNKQHTGSIVIVSYDLF